MNKLSSRRKNRLTDSLTGAYSRDSLDERLDEEVARALRSSSPFTLVMIDLDHFKSINDGFGHARGDAVLVEFARRLKTTTRRGDLVFRPGGDEFILLLPNTDKGNADVFARRLVEKVRSIPFEGNPPIQLTLSMGIACYPEDGQTSHELKAVADRRAYQAKRQGRDQVVDQDVELPGEPIFDDQIRLIERDEALDKLYQFIDGLPHQARAVLRVTGLASCGQSRFMLEVESLARLRGYAVLRMEGKPARQRRIYGALVDAVGLENLPRPSVGVDAFAAELNKRLQSLEKTGLVLVVHDLQSLDRATVNFLHDLYFAGSAIPQLAVVYSDHADGANLYFLNEVNRQILVLLQPFAFAGVRLWLRHYLQWEAPEEFVTWLHQETGGRPAEMKRTIQALAVGGLLRQEPRGWQMAATFSPLVHLPQQTKLPRGNLPELPGDFIGRVEELRRIKQLVRENRLVTILGAGGLGKTRLAQQAAAELADDFRDGVYFLPVASLSSPEYLLTALAETLQFPLHNVKNLRQELLEFMHAKEMLLVLDSFEHFLEAVPLILDMVEEAPLLRLLVTSRQRLSKTAGVDFELTPMAQPETAGEIEAVQFEAVQLFLHTAGLAHYQESQAVVDWENVVRICQLVQGIPLGLELAAAWTETLDCAEIAAELERSLDFLLGQPAIELDGPSQAGQQSLAPVFDAFWRSLSSYEQVVLMRLLVFQGGFGQQAAQSVAGASPFFLYALAAQSFLRRLPRRDVSAIHESRYEMHLLLQQYGMDKLRPLPGEKRQAEMAHCVYYANFLKELYPRMRIDRQALKEVRREIHNVRAAWNYAVEHTCLEQIEASVRGLMRYYSYFGLFNEGLRALARARTMLESGEFHEVQTGQVRRTLVKVLAQQARLEYLMAHYERAETICNDVEQRVLAEQANSQAQPEGQAQAFSSIRNEIEMGWIEILCLCEQVKGVASMNRGEKEKPLFHLNRALEWAQRIGDRSSEADCLRMIGNVHLDLSGHLQDAAEAYTRSLEICRELKNQMGEASTLNNLGLVALYQNDLGQARDYFNRLLAISSEDGNMMGKTTAQINVGLLETLSYNFEQSQATITPALMAAESVGAHTDAMLAAWGLAYMELARGDLEVAERRYEYVLKKIDDLSDTLSRARVMADLGLLYLRKGQAEQAQRISQELAELCQQYGLTEGPGYAFNHLGYACLELAKGNDGEMLAQAVQAFEKGVQAWKDELRENLMVEPLAGLALAKMRSGDPEAALGHVEAVLQFLQTGSLNGVLEPANVFLACWEVLQAVGDERAASILAAGRDFLLVRAERQTNPLVRKSLLENIPANARLLALANNI